MTTPDLRNLRRRRAQEHARWPLGLRVLLVLVGLYGLYLAFGYLLAPSLIKKQVEARGSTELHRPVTVEKVLFNPFRLTVTLQNLKVIDHDHQPLVGWQRLYVNLQYLALLRSEVHLAEIELDGFSGRLHVSKEGVLNIDDLTGHAVKPEPEAKGRKTWQFRIDRLSVNGAEIDYTDESRAELFHTHVGPSTFVLRNFRTSGQEGAPGSFSAMTEAGETLAWTGRIALAPLRSTGEIRIGQLAVKKYVPFYENLINFDPLSGQADLQIPYEFLVQNHQPEFKVTDASLHLHNLALAERNGKQAFFTLGSLKLEPVAADLQARSAQVGQLSLAGVHLSVRRDRTGLNLLQLLPVSSSANAVASTSPASSLPWTLALGEFAATGVDLHFIDQTLSAAPALELSDASVSVRTISSAQLSTPLPFAVRAKLGSTPGSLAIDGSFVPLPLRGDFRLNLTGVSLPSFSPWLEAFVKGRLSEGTAALQSQLHFTTGKNGLEISAASDAEIVNTTLSDAAGAPIVHWKTLTAHGLDYSTTPAHFGATEITWVEPAFSLTLSRAHVLNVSTLLGQPPQPTPPAPAPLSAAASPAGRPFVSVDHFAVENGSFTFLDESIEPAVKTFVSQFSGALSRMTSAAIDQGDVNFKGLVDGAAPVTLGGTANLLSEDLSADVKLSLDHADLLPLGPYVGHYIGYQLTSGGATLQTRAKLAKEKLDSATTLVVMDFALGAATNSPAAPHVPIHLALALLRDAQGKIVLNLPIQGDLADPKFEVGEVVWKLIIGLVTKAATSPFTLIGSMFGGGSHPGEDLSFVSFPAGMSDLDGTSLRKLDVVAKALHERPALRLALLGSASSTADLPVLREQAFTHRLQEAIFQESRNIDTTVTAPEQITVSAAAEARLIGKWYESRYLKPETKVEVPPPAKEPEKHRFFVLRWFEHDGGKKTAAEKPKATKESKKSPEARATAPVLPPLPEMRARLLADTPVAPTGLTDLAAKRAASVQTYVVQSGMLEAGRVSIAPGTAPQATTRVTLQLQ